MRMRAVKLKITIVTLVQMTLLSLMFTLTIPALSHAGVFFDTSFETCVVGGGASFPCEGWDDFKQEVAGVIDVVTSPTFSGGKSFRQTLTLATGVGNTYKPSIFKSFSATDHVFTRWAIRWSVPFQACQINGYTKHIRVKINNGFPLVWIVNYFGTYAVLVEAPYGNTTTLFQTGVPVTSGKWDQIEFEWKLNTPGRADGWLRFWIDGVRRIEALNKEWIGPTPTSFHPIYGSQFPTPSTAQITNTQIYVQCGNGQVWYDRFAVGDTRIGLATSQSSSDTTPPVIPSGVQAQ